MASPTFPTRLDVYCDTFGISLWDLRLPCVVCKSILPVSEAAEFHEKTLSVLWKQHQPFLACRLCLQRLAQHEQEHFHSGIITARELAAELGTPLLGIILRCKRCLRLLTTSEKADILANNLPIDKIRHCYRAVCKFCN